MRKHDPLIKMPGVRISLLVLNNKTMEQETKRYFFCSYAYGENGLGFGSCTTETTNGKHISLTELIKRITLTGLNNVTILTVQELTEKDYNDISQ